MSQSLQESDRAQQIRNRVLEAIKEFENNPVSFNEVMRALFPDDSDAAQRESLHAGISIILNNQGEKKPLDPVHAAEEEGPIVLLTFFEWRKLIVKAMMGKVR